MQKFVLFTVVLKNIQFLNWLVNSYFLRNVSSVIIWLENQLHFQAHRGMIFGAKYVKKSLDKHNILEKAFSRYPHYKLVLTGKAIEELIEMNYSDRCLWVTCVTNRCVSLGHSLGAAVAVLLALMIRPKYPDLKVYAICPPGSYVFYYFIRETVMFSFD